MFQNLIKMGAHVSRFGIQFAVTMDRRILMPAVWRASELSFRLKNINIFSLKNRTVYSI